MERHFIGSSTRKARRNGLRKVYPSKKIAPLPKKIMIINNNSMEEHCLWPGTIRKRHLMKKETKKKK